jgi:hypothetical protein
MYNISIQALKRPHPFTTTYGQHIDRSAYIRILHSSISYTLYSMYFLDFAHCKFEWGLLYSAINHVQ